MPLYSTCKGIVIVKVPDDNSIKHKISFFTSGPATKGSVQQGFHRLAYSHDENLVVSGWRFQFLFLS